MMQTLELDRVPLSSCHLIEASAGTGKTYTISHLYLRALVSRDLLPEQILVVTFTEAATQELRERIRGLLRQALVEAESGQLSAEIASYCQGLELSLLVRQLQQALQRFDYAAIYTIHGFCQRVLRDFAFECGVPLKRELCTDIAPYVQQQVAQLWREWGERLPASFMLYLYQQQWLPERIVRWCGPLLAKPYVRLLPDEEVVPEVSGLERALELGYQSLVQAWSQVAAEVTTQLLQSPGLNRQKYRLKSVEAWLQALEAWLEGGHWSAMPECLVKFSQQALQQAVKKGQQPVQHRFFVLCDEYLLAYEAWRTGCEQLRVACLRQLLLQLPGRLEVSLREQQLLGFDDLLLQLDGALSGEHAGVLTQALCQQFPVLLIDEFQDTDPLQYGIFRRLFMHPGQTVFLIGDPKQAIYSFRGADIFAYLAARQQVEGQWTLGTNYRSHQALVAGVNDLFSVLERPFWLSGIDYHPVAACGQVQETLQYQGQAVQGLCLQWWGDQDAQDRAWSGARLTQAVAEQCAQQINAWLQAAQQGECLVGERPLRPQDIAVLVRTHQQGLAVKQALQACAVPVVDYAQSSVWHSDQAWEWLQVLAAVAQPMNERRVKTALALPWFGQSLQQLWQYQQDELLWAQWMQQFQQYHQRYLRYGFMAMARQLLQQHGVLARLAQWQDGERRMTNLLHVMELLQQVVEAQPLSPAALLRWLQRQCAQPEMVEDALLRLDSDEARVKIVTIHKSKGLQYPVVLCPFLWEGVSSRATDPGVYHGSGQTLLDLSWPKQARDRVLDESFAERIRLIYVALTRAQYVCVVDWAKVSRQDLVPLAHILYGDQLDTGASLLDLSQWLKQQTAGELGRLLQLRASQASFSVQPPGRGLAEPWSLLESEVDLPGPRHCDITRQGWQLASFSSVVQGQHSSSTARVSQPASSTPSALSAFSFPRGAHVGNGLHDLLEHGVFAEVAEDSWQRLTRGMCQQYHLDPQWQPVLWQWLQRALHQPLPMMGCGLAQLAETACLKEMEFLISVDQLSAQGLATVFSHLRQHLALPDLPERMASLDQPSMYGMLKGFIDLIVCVDGRYYVIDYKSNYLGDRLQDYAAEGMAEAMSHAHYDLQYLIYSVAVRRWLQQRLLDFDPEQHWGGVLYLFLRGMQGDSDYGVFFHRPDEALLQVLDDYLAGRL